MTDPHPMLIAMAKAIAECDAFLGDPHEALDLARAALTTLAQPTPDMIEAGVEYWHTHDDFLDDEVTGIFAAMINTVLGER